MVPEINSPGGPTPQKLRYRNHSIQPPCKNSGDQIIYSSHVAPGPKNFKTESKKSQKTLKFQLLFNFFDSFWTLFFNFLNTGAGRPRELILNSVSNFGPEGPKNSSVGIEGSQHVIFTWRCPKWKATKEYLNQRGTKFCARGNLLQAPEPRKNQSSSEVTQKWLSGGSPKVGQKWPQKWLFDPKRSLLTLFFDPKRSLLGSLLSYFEGVPRKFTGACSQVPTSYKPFSEWFGGLLAGSFHEHKPNVLQFFECVFPSGPVPLSYSFSPLHLPRFWLPETLI